MPAHEVHRILARRYLGFSGEEANEVDRAIDLGPVHDLGRRLPRIPLYIEIISGQEPPARAKEAEDLLVKLLGNPRSAKLFFFHHGLDYLAYRAASAIYLGLDPNRACPNIVNGVMGDLDVVAGRVSYELPDMKYDVQRVFKEARPDVKGALERSCSDEVLLRWAETEVTPTYRRYADMGFVKSELVKRVADVLKKDLKYLLSYTLGVQGIPHTRSDVESLLQGKPVKVKVRDKEILITPEDALRSSWTYSALLGRGPHGLTSWALGRIRKSIAMLSSLHSGLYYVALVTDLPSSLIEERYLSTDKRRSSLARKALKLYKLLQYDPTIQIEAYLEKEFYFEELKRELSTLLSPDVAYRSMRAFVNTVGVLLEFTNELGIDVLRGY